MSTASPAAQEHALLSPSASAKWLICGPSALLEAKLKDENSVSAAEGTHAHLRFAIKITDYIKART